MKKKNSLGIPDSTIDVEAEAGCQKGSRSEEIIRNIDYTA